MRNLDELGITDCGKHAPRVASPEGCCRDVADLESAIGFKLPREYVEFLNSANGAGARRASKASPCPRRGLQS